MNPLWILGAFLLLGKKKNNPGPPPPNPGNPGNPVVDDYLDRM